VQRAVTCVMADPALAGARVLVAIRATLAHGKHELRTYGSPACTTVLDAHLQGDDDAWQRWRDDLGGLIQDPTARFNAWVQRESIEVLAGLMLPSPSLLALKCSIMQHGDHCMPADCTHGPVPPQLASSACLSTPILPHRPPGWFAAPRGTVSWWSASTSTASRRATLTGVGYPTQRASPKRAVDGESLSDSWLYTATIMAKA
jgi:hypothetical protein